MKKINPHKSIIKQQGAVVLFVSIVLLFGVTLITIFAARVGVMDQRISANEYRHKEAKSAADAALEQASAFIEQNSVIYSNTSSHWSDCSASSALQNTFPCSIGAETYEKVYSSVSGTTIYPLSYTTPLSTGADSNSYIVFTTSTDTNGTPNNILTAVGVGKSLDGTGEAHAQVSYIRASSLDPGKMPPILSPSVDISGSFTIIADPRVTFDESIDCTDVTPTTNWATDKGNISVWVNTITSGGTWQTCEVGAFKDPKVASNLDDDVMCVFEYDDTDDWSNCACDSGQHLSDSGGTGRAGYTPVDEHDDIKVPENVIEDFPESPFKHFFNGSDSISVADFIALKKAEIREKGTIIEGDCTNADLAIYTTTDRPIVWCTGKATVGDIGTQLKPIIIIAEGGKATINGSSNVWGVLIGLQDITINGGAIVHGAVIMEDTDTYTLQTLGNYHQVYDFCVLSGLAEDSLNTDISKVKYSWKDY